MDKKTKKPNAGTCAICGGVWMLDKRGRLANHGFQRPGYGSQTGGCPGEKSLPYERSVAILEELVDSLQSQLKREQDALRQFEGNEIGDIFDQFTPRKPNGMPALEKISKGHPNYEASLARLRKNLQRSIEAIEHDIKRYQYKIDRWPGEQPLKYKEPTKNKQRSNDPDPLLETIEIGKQYRYIGYVVTAKEKGHGGRRRGSWVRVETEKGLIGTVTPRQLKPI